MTVCSLCLYGQTAIIYLKTAEGQKLKTEARSEMDLMNQLKWEAFLTFYTQGHSACPEEDQICIITGFLWACAAPWRQVWGLWSFW